MKGDTMQRERTPPPMVADPGLRYLLKMTRRAMLQVCAAIAVVTGTDPEPEPNQGKEELCRAA